MKLADQAEQSLQSLKGAVEGELEKIGEASRDTEKTLRDTRSALEQEIKERSAAHEEVGKAAIENRNYAAQLKQEAIIEKEERMEENSAIRSMLQTYDGKVMAQFKEFK